MNIDKYIRVFRINHWIKNLFTIMGSLMYVFVIHPSISGTLIIKIILAFFVSCFLSSVNYVVNEIFDSSFDAMHPQKKYRPIPSGRISVYKLCISAILLFVITFIISLPLFDSHFNIWLFTLFIAGLVYNVPPIRAKDIPFIDVISESINNPIRLFIGWYAVSPPESVPPISIMFFFWTFGAYILTAKRIAELKLLGEDSQVYRITFRYYTPGNLTTFLILYAVSSVSCYIYFSLRHEYSLLFSMPFYIVFLVWYARLAYKKETVVMNPEYIFKYPALTFYIILSCLFTLLNLIVYGYK